MLTGVVCPNSLQTARDPLFQRLKATEESVVKSAVKVVSLKIPSALGADRPDSESRTVALAVALCKL